MTVRRAEEKDIPVLLHLLEQVNLVHHKGRPDLFKKTTKYSVEDLMHLLSDPDRPVFVCEADGTVLGHAFCIMQVIQNDRMSVDRKTLYIDDICVDESARKEGIGRALYRYCESYARESGCYNLTLNVWTCNPSAMRFYEKMGLKPQKIGMERIL
jgi:ribosomal protein S18 acetylase RimI-like enzyme